MGRGDRVVAPDGACTRQVYPVVEGEDTHISLLLLLLLLLFLLLLYGGVVYAVSPR